MGKRLSLISKSARVSNHRHVIALLKEREDIDGNYGVNLKKNGSIDIGTVAPARFVSFFEVKLWLRW